MSRYLVVKCFVVSTYKPLCPKVVFDFDPKKNKKDTTKRTKKREERPKESPLRKNTKRGEREREKKNKTQCLRFHFIFCG